VLLITDTENVSKNRNGSFKQLHVKSKIVPVFACPAAGERCPFHILDTYISKLPPQAFEKDLFYVRPLEAAPPTLPVHGTVPFLWVRTHSMRKLRIGARLLVLRAKKP